MAPYQDESGFWHTVVDRPDFYLETSGALAIGYGVRKAVREGHLSIQHMAMASKIARGAKAKVGEDDAVLDVSEGTRFYDSVEEYNQIPHDRIQLWGQGLYLLFATRAPYAIYLPLVQKKGQVLASHGFRPAGPGKRAEKRIEQRFR